MKYALHFGPEALHIEMEGRFSFRDSHLFHMMLSAIAEEETRPLIRINIQNVTNIDSTALRLLMMAYDMSKKMHRPLVFEHPQGEVSERLAEAARYNRFQIAA